MKTTKTSYIELDEYEYEIDVTEDVGESTRTIIVHRDDQFVVELVLDHDNKQAHVHYSEETGEIDYNDLAGYPPKYLAVWLVENWLENG